MGQILNRLKDMEEGNRQIIFRYYSELWNRWEFAIASDLIASDISFRGSLAVEVQGLQGFKDYMNLVRSAFPDFHNTIEELIVEEDKVVARLAYHGTHRGEIFGVKPTGRKVAYAGVGIFRIAESKIVCGWVLGDIPALLRQLNG